MPRRSHCGKRRHRCPAAGRARTDRPRRARPSPCSAVMASSTVSENTEMQSSVRHAGTSPAFEIRPRLGFRPTMLLSIAGTRPLPAVSVPSASGTRPADDRDGRSRTRAARHEIAAHRISGNAVGRAHADEAGGELVEVGLADHDGAGRAQPARLRSDPAPADRRRPGRRRWSARPRASMLSFTATGTPIQRKLGGVLPSQRFRLPPALPFSSREGDEDGGVVMVADALEAARHGLFGEVGAGAMRGDNRGYGLRRFMSPLTKSARRIRLRDRSKRCALLYKGPQGTTFRYRYYQYLIRVSGRARE